MFESALFESTHALPQRSRWTNATALAMPVTAILLLLMAGLLHPALLPLHVDAPTLFVPPPPPPPVVRPQTRPVPISSSPATTSAVPETVRVIAADRLNSTPVGANAPALTLSSGMAPTGRDAALVSSMGTGSGHALVTIERAAASVGPKAPLHISSGVSAGLLLAPILPVYPAIARSARIGGIVTVHAVISTDGRVLQAVAVSGPEMLRGAALDAVARARYRPFLLNGQPTAVDTTFTIDFKLE